MKTLRKKLKEKKGFTLIEMIIVIAIIAILIALIAPNMKKYLDSAKETKANATAKTLYTVINTYTVDQYASGAASIGTVSWDKAAVETNVGTYFNGDELKTIDSCTVTFENGTVTSVKITDKTGITGTYPQESTPAGGSGTGTN